MECDWIVASVPCAACDGQGEFPVSYGELVGAVCSICGGTGLCEYEGPDRLASA